MLYLCAFKLHYNTKHASFKESYPEQSDARQRKISAIKSQYSHASGIINRTSTEQERATSASLQAAWVLSKQNKPSTHAEGFKECVVAVLEKPATDKSIDGIIASVKRLFTVSMFWQRMSSNL